jgi:hypothetical protein
MQIAQAAAVKSARPPGGVDREGVPNPIEPPEKLPEAEAPACQCGATKTVLVACGTVEEKHQHRVGNEQCRKEIERRETERRRDSGEQGKEVALPAGALAQPIAGIR